MAVEWREAPGTLRAVRVITIVGAVLATLGGCLVGVAALSASGSTVSGTGGGLVWLAVFLVLVEVAVGWLQVWLAVGACAGNNTRRWVLVAFCWVGVALNVVSIPFSGLGLGVVVNLAVDAVLLGLLQFSTATNDYLREMNQPGLATEPPAGLPPLPGTDDTAG